MAVAKRRAKIGGLGVYTLTAAAIFISSTGYEADLPQPCDGKAACWITSDSADILIEYDGPDALEAVIFAHFQAVGWGYVPVDPYAEYYQKTWEDFTNVVASIKRGIKHSSGLDALFEGI